MNSVSWLANFAIFAEIANCLRTDCEIRLDCELFANSLRNSLGLRIDCEQVAKIPVLLLPSDFQYMLQNLHTSY